ncbi:MAG: DNA-formamidopyrimidine glycosylase [FCB group bacterium]|nr:DNA-formamidopyrimidine glycosylase [FCB group bacterium]
MPELPEVETVVRSLIHLLAGKKITDFRSHWFKVVDNLPEADFRQRIVGTTIKSLDRRAKFIVINTNQNHILVHLRMTGKLFWQENPPDDLKHITAIFTLDRGFLIFRDVRKFGRIYFYENLEKFYSRFGPEPLSDEFTVDWLSRNLKNRSRKMKPLLLDQSFLAGLGNIYVDEILWHSRVHPLATASDLSARQIRDIHRYTQSILRAAIESKGSTIKDFSFQGQQSGVYVDQLQVFARTGEACPRCAASIIKMKVAQRGTHICPECQKKKCLK